MIFQLAKFGFMIWGIYRGFWVVRKLYGWCARKLAERRAENEFIGRLAAQIRCDRETGGEFLRSTPSRS